jgi:predicted ATPase
MKLAQLKIENFRSCRDIVLEMGNIQAFVGANNAGKSSMLRALDFFFNPSTKSLNEESFWNKDTSLEIRVEALFVDLQPSEKTALAGYLRPDGTFHVARIAQFNAESSGVNDDEGKSKITISQQCKLSRPSIDWLQEDNISSTNITEWWKNKDELVVGKVSFSALWGGDIKKPTVTDWKEKAKQFIDTNATIIPMNDAWIDNPKGYANVLKAILPFFILVPAIRDVTDESKGTKSSPFGRLLYAILNTVAADTKAKIADMLTEVSKQLNRIGGDQRVPLIKETETKLNSLLEEFFTGCDLEIEFPTPTMETLMSTPKLFIDDGFRNSVENKGHGLQRAVIFTILRRYAEYVVGVDGNRSRRLILGVEEPELYMHPQAQRTIRCVFRKIAQAGDQVFFSTHSSLLVDVAHFDEIVRLENKIEITSGKKVVQSYAWQLSMQRMIQDIEARHPDLKGKISAESIRDLYSHVYNPRRNEGFFASKIILVEGATEEYGLPIYAAAIAGVEFDSQNISVVECGGKGSMDRLYRIFNELHIPCYLLFDYDKDNPDKNITEKSKELLKLAGETVQDPQSLFVGKCAACFVKTWETDLRSEIPDIDNLTKEARKTLGLNSDSGKPLIARYIARKLSLQTPPYIPPCVKCIIEKAVSVTWEKSCLAQT